MADKTKSPPQHKHIVSRFHAFPWGVLIAVTATALVKIPPEQSLPVHWGIDGKPDDFWPRNVTLAVGPVLAILLTAIFALIDRLAPRNQVEGTVGIWGNVLTALLGVICAVQFSFILMGVGSDIDLLRWLSMALAAALVVVGGLLTQSPYKAYSGVRLPWTMPNAGAWAFAARASGAILALSGLGLGLVAGLWPSPANLLAAIGGALAVSALGSIAFSLIRMRG